MGAVVFISSIVAAGFIVGFAFRGSLRNFGRVSVHWWGLALAGLALQVAPLPARLGAGWGVAALIASYVLLIGFMWVNRRLPAAPLILAGLLLNLAVIAVNGGMPVSAEAIRSVGADGAALITGSEGTKHHLMTSSDLLTPLADVIPVPPPVGVILSVGDVCIYGGVVAFIVLVMLGRGEGNRRPKARLPMYRGKHLPVARRMHQRAVARRASTPTAAGRSGTAR
jgi:hypothetical protein